MIGSDLRLGVRPFSCCIIAAGFMAVSSLSGCGSGGDGSSSGASAVSITQQNSPQVAGASYQAANTAQGTSNTGSATFISVVATKSHNRRGLARFAQQQIVRLMGLDSTTEANSASGLVVSDTLPCDVPGIGGTAGTISVEANDADGSGTLSTGDTVSATFNNCYTSIDGQSVNGGFSLTGLTISGDPQLANTGWTVGATFSFKSISIADISGTETVNGGFSYSGNTSDGINISASLSGTSLSVAESGGPTISLSNFHLTGTVNENTSAYLLYGSGRVTDSALNGYVNFDISSATPLQGIGDQDPDSGSMTVTGADNSSVKVTAIDSSSAQLQVDADGDGTAEYTVTKTWIDLAP
jgi:hypothetical protein